jgi:hypothetical protein
VGDIQHAGSERAVQAATSGPAPGAEPRRIGGWLLVVGLGQVVGLLQLFIVLGQYYLAEKAGVRSLARCCFKPLFAPLS